MRRGRLDESGLTLIEVVVALTILSLLMLAVAATLANALRLTREARGRAVAAKLAQSEVELVRAQPVEDIETGLVVRTEQVGGVEYTIRRAAEWIEAGATGDACQTSGPADLAYLRVDVSVTWPGARGDGVSTRTIVTPDVGAFDPEQGHIAVRVLDRDAAPSVGTPVWVRAQSGTTARTVITTAEGCAFIDHLTPGTYDVWLDRPGYVDPQADPQPTQAVGVVRGAVVQVAFDFDRAATLELTLSGAQGGALPEGVDVTLRNTGLQPDTTVSYPGSGSVRTIEPVYPFASGYEVWASTADCADNDPAHPDHGGTRQLVTVDPGRTTTAEVLLPTLEVRVRNPAGQPVPGVRVTAEHAADPASCAAGATLELGRSGADGAVLAAIPFGTWTIDLPGQGATPVEVRLSTLDAPTVVTVTVGS